MACAALILLAGLAPSAGASQLYAYSEQTVANLNFNAVPVGGGTGAAGTPIFTSASSAALPLSGDAASGTTDVRESFTPSGSPVDPGQNFFAPVGINPTNYSRGDAFLNTGGSQSPLSTVAETSFNGLTGSSAGNGNYSIRVTFTVTSGSFTLTPTLTYTNSLSVSTGGSAIASAVASYGFEITISPDIVGALPIYDVTPAELNNVRIAQPDATFNQGPTALTLAAVTLGPGSYVLQIIGDSTVSTTQLAPGVSVPEPSTLASAAGAVFFGLAYLRRTRRKAASA